MGELCCCLRGICCRQRCEGWIRTRYTRTGIPKLLLTPEMERRLRERCSNVLVYEEEGRKYVVLWNLPSCAFIRGEGEKLTAQNLAFSLLKFFQWRGERPEDLLERYRGDREMVARDLAHFVISHRGMYSSSYLQRIEWAVRAWLYVNGIELPSKVLRKRYRIRFKHGHIGDAPPCRMKPLGRAFWFSTWLSAFRAASVA